MNSPRSARWAALILAWLSPMATISDCRAGQEVDRADFSARLKASVDRVEQARKNLRVEGQVHNFLDKTRPIPEDARTTPRPMIYARRDDQELLDYSIERESGPYFHRLILLRGGRGEVLRMNDPNGKFFLEIPEVPEKYKQELERDRDALAGRIHSFFLINLADALRNPDFVIDRVEAEKDGGLDRDRVYFHAKEARVVGEKPQTFEVKGSFDVDPANSHAITSYKARRERTTPGEPTYFNEGDGSASYAPNTSLPEVTASVQNMVTSRGQHTRDSTVVKSWSYEVVPEEQFGLAYHGLGDLETPVSQRGLGLTAWAVIAGVVALSVGLLLKIFVGRSKPAEG